MFGALLLLAQDHWALQPLRRVDPPAVRDAAWVRTPVDRFILAALEARGQRPRPPADRRTLARRAHLTLLGLPPPPDEAPDPDHAALVARLLESPHFGERWARHWLDVARFGESFGGEHDYDRPHAWPYRDFVIRAFNQDLPYDRFVAWQLAGDELAPEDPMALAATGFLGAGVFPTQLTEREFERARYDELDDMLSTVGTAMLGLTFGCARCHDHKFDPIPTADYYGMLAVFGSAVRSEIEVDEDPAGHAAALAKFQETLAPFTGAISKFESDALPGRLAAWEATLKEPPAPGWEILEIRSFASAGGAESRTLDDGSILITGTNPKFDTYTITAAPRSRAVTAVRIEAITDPSMVKGGPGRAANGNFCLTDLKLSSGGEALAFAGSRSTFDQAGLGVANVIDTDKKTGWAVDPQFGKNHAAVFDLAAPAGDAPLTFRLDFHCNTGHNIGRLRLSVATTARPAIDLSGPPPALTGALSVARDRRTPEQTSALIAWYRTQDPEWRRLRAALDEQRAKAPQPRRLRVMVCSEGLPPMKHHADDRGYPHFYPKTHLLKRGDPSQKGPVVEPGFLQVLSARPDPRWQQPPPAGARTSHRRAAFSRWIADADRGAGALLARVIVNRLWQHHLGRGLVATPSDFGRQGTPPTHPELLDWLASELIRNGWRLKPIHALIATSAVAMQGSAGAGDPTLYARFEPRRLDAEVIRDQILAVSGTLDPTPFGPGTLDPGSRRRSIYFTIKRSALPAMLVAFDLPEPLVGIGCRSATTVAPQALYMLNAPQVRAAAVALARRAGGDPARAFRLALSRDPTDAERRDALDFLARQESAYRDAGRDPALALADLCQVILGLNEFAFIE